jgi:hypothetical protein
LLGASLRRGILGFTAVSVAGFAPWVFLGHWFHRHIGEAGLYTVCAFLFIGLSGLLLHRLIIGPGSLGRFYALFGIAFAGYSAAWILGRMTLRGHSGSLAGLLAGALVMGGVFARAFDARGAAWKVSAVIFILNAAGYFVGGWIEGLLMPINAQCLGSSFRKHSRSSRRNCSGASATESAWERDWDWRSTFARPKRASCWE